MCKFKWKSKLTFSIKFQVFRHYPFDFDHAEIEIDPKLYEQVICNKLVNFMIWLNEILYE